jgi:hypothetical protein
MNYKVLVGLNYPTSPAVIERLKALRDAPESERQAGVAAVVAEGGFKRAEVGVTVSDLPEVSVPWLLFQGVIEAVADKPRPVACKIAKEE